MERRYVIAVIIVFAWVLAATVVLGTLPSLAASAGDSDAQLDFLFSADQEVSALPANGVSDAIEKKSIIQENEWLNQPLTRLDYVLMKMESTISESSGATLEMAGIVFERSTVMPTDPSAYFSVRYSESVGRIFVSSRLENVGEPKRPMTETCEYMIDHMDAALPLAASGYSWHNNAIGLLQRGEASEYDEIVQVLADSAVLTATVDALYKVRDYGWSLCHQMREAEA